MPSSRTISCISILTVIISCIFVIIGIIGIILGPGILQKQINNNLPLKVDSDQLDSWATPPVPIYLQFWLWECINLAALSNGSS
ncbi:unnamed protein product [Rotaria sp. Silwood2]|nr:unnamed protein product [Rotaria sp. Silwood2]